MKLSNLFRSLIVEFDLQKTIAIFQKQVDARKRDDRSFPKEEDKILEDLKAVDPTRTMDYGRWIIQTWANGGINRWEDVLARVGPALVIYDKAKRKNKLSTEHKNIFNLKTLSDLEDLAEQYVDAPVTGKDLAREESAKAKAESKVIHVGSEVMVVQPLTEFASCYYGKSTRWCTAATQSGNMFNSYNSSGGLWIFIPKSPKRAKEKYQLHRTNEFYVADENDNTFPFVDLILRFPHDTPEFLNVKVKVFSKVTVVFNKENQAFYTAYVIQKGHKVEGAKEFYPGHKKSENYMLEVVGSVASEKEVEAVKEMLADL